MAHAFPPAISRAKGAQPRVAVVLEVPPAISVAIKSNAAETIPRRYFLKLDSLPALLAPAAPSLLRH
jgi:hypothetical protein